MQYKMVLFEIKQQIIVKQNKLFNFHENLQMIPLSQGQGGIRELP